jgi:hypothetical protein
MARNVDDSRCRHGDLPVYGHGLPEALALNIAGAGALIQKAAE